MTYFENFLLFTLGILCFVLVIFAVSIIDEAVRNKTGLWIEVKHLIREIRDWFGY